MFLLHSVPEDGKVRLNLDVIEAEVNEFMGQINDVLMRGPQKEPVSPSLSRPVSVMLDSVGDLSNHRCIVV